MPHFGHGMPINTCVKKIFVFFHGGFLWLGNPISIDVKLVVVITSLPFAGMDPKTILRKDQEVSIAAQMK